MKKIQTKYYFIYLISFLILSFIWVRPIVFQENQIDKILETDVEITTKSYQIEEVPKTDQTITKEWFFVSKLNQIISLVVGLFNFYFIMRHIKNKRAEKKLLKNA